MLTPWDEFLCHQLPTTMDHVFTSDPAWTERIYISLYDVANKEAILGCGVGQYPNKNVQDGFATVWHAGKQYNVRMSRRLRPTPHEIRIGPLFIEILEGLRRFRMRLDENPSGMSFDIEWIASMNPHEEAHDFRRSNGRVVQDISRFDQACRARGTLTIPGRTFVLDERTWWGHRDRSWGVRRPLRTEASDTRRTRLAPFLFSWSIAQFPDHTLHWRFVERAEGRYSYFTGERVLPVGQPPEPGWKLEQTRQEFRWDGSGPVQTLVGGNIELTFENGQRREVSFVTHPPRWHLKGGGYGGYRGWHHGDDKGPSYFEHEMWDLADPTVRAEASTLSDHLIEWRSGGAVGYGIMEYGVGAGYYKYKEVQHLPTF
jgi:hypothetical protein